MSLPILLLTDCFREASQRQISLSDLREMLASVCLAQARIGRTRRRWQQVVQMAESPPSVGCVAVLGVSSGGL